jgi:hypothetical protein
MIGDYERYMGEYLHKLEGVLEESPLDYYTLDYFENLGLKVD